MNINKLIEGQREELQKEFPEIYQRIWLPVMNKEILIKFLDSEIERLQQFAGIEMGYYFRDQIEHFQDIKKQLE